MRRFYILVALFTVSLCGCATQRTVQVNVIAHDVADRPSVDVSIQVASRL